MSDVFEKPQPRADLIDEASAWLATLDAGSADRAAFETWRDADVRHAIAFAEVAGTWQDLDSLRIIGPHLSPAPAIAIATPDGPDTDRLHRRHVLRAAASIVAVAVIGGGVAYRGDARETRTTRVGERRTIMAVPGVSLDLNTDTCVRWQGDAPIRFWLERGEVALRLSAGHRAELRTAAGRFQLGPGVFNARIRGGGCELAVIAGNVTDGRAVRLMPADIAWLTAGYVDVRSNSEADLARVVAWQRDTLILSGESLDYALAEMNRYLPSKIVIGDPALSRLRLGGSFSTTGPSEFLHALHTSFGIRARTGPDGDVVLTRI